MHPTSGIVTRGYRGYTPVDPLPHLNLMYNRTPYRAQFSNYVRPTSSSWRPPIRPIQPRFVQPNQGRFQWVRPQQDERITANQKSLEALKANVEEACQFLAEWKAAKAKREQEKPRTDDEDSDVEVLEVITKNSEERSSPPSSDTSRSSTPSLPGASSRLKSEEREELQKTLLLADEKRKEAMESLLRKRAILSMKNKAKSLKPTVPSGTIVSRYKIVRGQNSVKPSSSPVIKPAPKSASKSRYKFVRKSIEETARRPSSEYFVSQEENELFRLIGEKKFVRTRPETGRRCIVTQFKLIRVPSSPPATTNSRYRYIKRFPIAPDPSGGTGSSSLPSNGANERPQYKKIGRYSLIKVSGPPAVATTPSSVASRVIRSRYSLRRVPTSAPSGLNTTRSRFSMRREPLPAVQAKTNNKYSFIRSAARQRTSSASTLNAQSVVSKYLWKNSQATRKSTAAQVSNTPFRWRASPFCAFFNRHGYCEKEKTGSSCPFKHDPLKITMCPLFLTEGHCEKPNCLLIHRSKWSEGQTQPLCVFLLRGKCDGFRSGRRRCVLLHPEETRQQLLKRDLCSEFVRTAYCSAGLECTKLHVSLCQKFAVTGNCPDGDECPNFHKKRTAAGKKPNKTSLVRKTNPSPNFAPDTRVDKAGPNPATGEVRYFSRETASPLPSEVIACYPKKRQAGNDFLSSGFIPL